MKTKKTCRGRRSDIDARQTRLNIIQRASAIFAKHGFDAASIRDIAAQSGVTHGLIRHHFGTKEDIWRAVIDALIEELMASAVPLIEAAQRNNTTAHDTVKAVSRHAIILTARYPNVIHLLVHESVDGGARLDYFMLQLMPIRRLMDPLISDVQREGGLSQFTHETFLLSLIMLGAMPLGLTAFSNKLCNFDILASDEIEKHADRVIAILLGDD